MLTKSGAKLLDFGLAKLTGHGEQPAAAYGLWAESTRAATLTGQPIGHSIDDHCSTVPAHGLLKRREDAERPMVCPAKPRRAATVPSTGRIASFEGA